MKNLIFTHIAFILVSVCTAQEEILINNDWYLEKLVIQGENYPFPENQDEFDFVSLNFIHNEEFSTQEIVTSVCNVFFSPIEYNDNFSFELLALGSGLAHCIEPINMNYEELYAGFYGLSDMPVTTDYSYEIIENGSSLKLTIVNENQDEAIYNSTILSSSNFEASDFSIFPNPASNELRIQTDNTTVKHIEIFNLSGKRVLQSTYNSNVAMDVSSLAKGLYIVKIETDSGSFTKKLVKE